MKRKILALILILVILASVHFIYKKARAFMPFGGKILFTKFCSCGSYEGGIMIIVGPPVGGTFVYMPGATVLYPYHQITFPGPWVLGVHSSIGGTCGVLEKSCVDQTPVMGMINIVGTSMF